MTLTLAVLALATSVNPVRAWLFLPRGPERKVAAVVGAALAAVGVVGAAVIATPALGWVSISAPMARLAAGAVLLLGAAMNLLGPTPSPDPALPGWRAGLVPVAVPALVRPDVFLVALTVAADHGVAPTLAIAIPVLIAVVAIAIWPPPPPSTASARLVDGAARFLAGLGAAVGIALLLSGIYSL